MNALVTAALLLALARQRRRSRARRFGIHPILRQRKDHGHFHALFKDLKADPQRFHRFVRMDEERFDKLLGLIRHRLTRTSQREPLSPAERLLVTLRFLATGNSFASIATDFYIGHTTAGRVIGQTCAAIAEELLPTYVRTPTTAAEWRAVADGFDERWDLPHAIGAIDGKHVQIRAPPRSGTTYHNYKGTFSTVLLAMCDHRHRIIYANWHNYGSNGDAGIFDRSELKQMLSDPSNPLDLPPPEPLPMDAEGADVPYFVVGDGAFPLMPTLMKPFGTRNMSREKRIFNYRLSRARRVIESTFGILCMRWRILLRPIETSVEKAECIVQAVMCLHNFLIDEVGEPFTQGVPQTDSSQECPLEQAQIQHPNARRAADAAAAVREKLVDYVNGIGAVDWQEERALYQPAQDADSDEDA